LNFHDRFSKNFQYLISRKSVPWDRRCSMQTYTSIYRSSNRWANRYDLTNTNNSQIFNAPKLSIKPEIYTVIVQCSIHVPMNTHR